MGRVEHVVHHHDGVVHATTGSSEVDSRANHRAHDGGRGDAPVKQRLGQNRDARHTINAHRREYYHDDEEGSVAKNY